MDVLQLRKDHLRFLNAAGSFEVSDVGLEPHLRQLLLLFVDQKLPLSYTVTKPMLQQQHISPFEDNLIKQIFLLFCRGRCFCKKLKLVDENIYR